MTLPLGQEIPNLTFKKPDGSDVHLHDFRGKPLLVIFLRHLA